MMQDTQITLHKLPEITVQSIPNAANVEKIISVDKGECRLQKIDITGFTRLQMLHVQNKAIAKMNSHDENMTMQEMKKIIQQVKQLKNEIRQKKNRLRYVLEEERQQNQIPTTSLPMKTTITFSTKQASINDTKIQSERSRQVEIVFKNNQMESISEYGISHRLKRLTCSNCEILTIQIFAQECFPVLQVLTITKNLFDKVPKLNIPEIKKISFSNNLLSSVDQFFTGNYEHLTQLDISHNFLKEKVQIKLPSLEILNLNNNYFQIIPRLLTPKLNTLKVMQNFIICDVSQLADSKYLNNLEHLQIQVSHTLEFPLNVVKKLSQKIKSLRYISSNPKNAVTFLSASWPQLRDIQEFSVYNSQQKDLGQQLNYLPKMNMPNVLYMKVRLPNQIDPSLWFLGFGNGLKSITIRTGWQGEFPILNLPNLESLNLQMYKIQQLSNIFQSNFPKLQQLQLSEQIQLQKIKNYKGEWILEQLITNKYCGKQIIPLASFNNYGYISNMKCLDNLRDIKIDISKLGTTQFLTFLDFEQVKNIQFQMRYLQPRIIKNLAKINFNRQNDDDSPNHITIWIAEQDWKINQFSFRNSRNGCQNSRFSIENDDQWRRFYTERKGQAYTHWSYERRVNAGKSSYSIAQNFHKKLNGYKVRQALKVIRQWQILID